VKRIGTVEILRARVYALDAESHDDLRSTVVVEPGCYELFSNGMTTHWMMHGRLNLCGVERLGDGLFALHTGDMPSEIEVVFPSRRFGEDEWAELIAGPEFTEGPQQRLRVRIDAEVPS
jgi:hypothetical protein